MLLLASVTCGALPAQAVVDHASPQADVWVRHETDSPRRQLPVPWSGGSPAAAWARPQFQERVFTVHRSSPAVLGAQSFCFHVQSDPCRNRLLWMRLINTHGHGHTGDRTFHYDPARWEARISLPGPDGTYEDLTSQLTHGRSESRYSDGFPLGQVVPDAAGSSSVVIKVTVRPKVMPAPNSGVCISLWTPGLFGFPDSATASLVYR